LRFKFLRFMHKMKLFFCSSNHSRDAFSSSKISFLLRPLQQNWIELFFIASSKNSLLYKSTNNILEARLHEFNFLMGRVGEVTFFYVSGRQKFISFIFLQSSICPCPLTKVVKKWCHKLAQSLFEFTDAYWL